MTEAEILLVLIDAVVVFVAASLFVHFLCDEYLRALEWHGLIRRPTAKAPSGESEPSPAERT